MTNVIPTVSISFDDHAVELELVRNGVTRDQAFWKGEAVFVAFDEIRDLPTFLRAIERVLVVDDFGGLLMGQGRDFKHKFELTHLTITRRSLMTDDDLIRFGDQAAAMINLQYKIIWQSAVDTITVVNPRAYKIE